MSEVADIAARLAKKKKVVSVVTDEGTVYIRGMNGAERNEYFTTITTAADSEKLSSNQRLIAMQLCNADGSPAFKDEKAGLATVLQWDMSDVAPMVDAILKASGLNAGAQDDAAKK